MIQVTKLQATTVRLIVSTASGMMSAELITCSMISDKMIPIAPPSKVRIRFSTMNWPISVLEDAPNAFRTPISEDLSMIRLMFMFTRFSVGSTMKMVRKMANANSS